MVLVKSLIVTIFFIFMYSIPFIVIEDKIRVKCDLLYVKYGKLFKYEYKIEYKLRKNWFSRFFINKKDKKKWKKFRKFVYFNTEL